MPYKREIQNIGSAPLIIKEDSELKGIIVLEYGVKTVNLLKTHKQTLSDPAGRNQETTEKQRIKEELSIEKIAKIKYNDWENFPEHKKNRMVTEIIEQIYDEVSKTRRFFSKGKKQPVPSQKNEALKAQYQILMKDKFVKDANWLITQHITSQYTIKTLLEDGSIWCWENGVYVKTGENHIRNCARKICEEALTKYNMSEIIAQVQGETYVSIEEFNKELTKISMLNGIYDFETHTLHPHDPEFLTFTQIPVNYDPKAKCERWDQFMEEVIILKSKPDEIQTYENQIKTLQEYTGYCFLRESIYHRALMLTGDGSNGKSVFLETIQELLGKANISTVPLQAFDSKEYALSSMLGKLANIHADLSDKNLKETGNFKLIVTGEPVYINQKYKDALNTPIYAKQMFSANKVPQSPDNTLAFFRRWLIIDFPNVFTEENRDIHLKNTLATELSGIFNWAIIGLKNLRENNKFSHELTPMEMENLYVSLSNPVATFVAECLEQNSTAEVPKTKMYGEYVAFTKERKLPTKSENAFARELLLSAVRIESTRPKVDGNRVQCWLGWEISREMEKIEIEEQRKCEGCESETNVKEYYNDFFARDKNKPPTIWLCDKCLDFVKRTQGFSGEEPKK